MAEAFCSARNIRCPTFAGNGVPPAMFLMILYKPTMWLHLSARRGDRLATAPVRASGTTNDARPDREGRSADGELETKNYSQSHSRLTMSHCKTHSYW
jgi:hypothetical protein